MWRSTGGWSGQCFGLLDYNPRIKEIDGRLFPFGFIHLLRNKCEIKKIRLISTNVLPEYQMHGLGLVLMHGIVPKAMEWGIQEAEFSWVLESNRFSRGALTKGGAKITKTYRVYDIDFDPAEVAAQRQSRRRAAVSRGGWKSGRSSPAATSTRSSRCLGGFMPKIRNGCRSCCWTRKSSSIPASIPSICTGRPRNSSPTATACPRDASS